LSSGNGDRLSLGAGLTADILTFDRVGTSVTLHFAGQSGSIYLERQFEDFDNGVEQIAFANGTVWTKADLQSAYLARIQTAGSDLVEGFGSNDTPQGGAGDDQLYGDYGNDVYVYNAGDGNDRIFEGMSTGNGDRLSLGAGLTADVLTFDRVGTSVTLRFAGGGSIYLDRQFEGYDYGVEQIAFANGTTWTKLDRSVFLSTVRA
jgi:trimeric autotransporter adhesin